jgi:hypothetical protein
MKPGLMLGLILAVAVNFAMPSSQGFGQEGATGYLPEMSREDWQARVNASRAQAELMRHERRRFAIEQPTAEEIAERNSRRILEDDSLLPGDIVSTDRGLFQFRGSSDRNRRSDDFVRIR